MAAAGSVIKTRHTSKEGYEIHMAWTADASGDVAEGGTTGKGIFTAHGYLHSYYTVPGATASDNYDITLLDDEDIDVLRNQGLNQQQTGDQTYDTKYRSNNLNVDGNYLYFHNQNLTLTIANAGNATTGIVVFKFVR